MTIKRKALTDGELETLAKLSTRAHALGITTIPGFVKEELYLETAVQLQEQKTEANQITATLAQRGARYGDFTDHARLAQELQRTLHYFEVTKPNWNNTGTTTFRPWQYLTPVNAQALTVIMDKIARILSGDQFYDDNWIDIQGYAKLAQDRLIVNTPDTEPFTE